MDLIERVRYRIEQSNMIDRGDYVIAGVSGGADSVCLLCVLAQLRTEPSSSDGNPFFELSAIHVNHQIRGAEAVRDEEFVKELCKRLGIGLDIVYADVPDFARTEHMSLEEAGRIVRQRAFAQRALELNQKGYSVKAALAHHMDDRAETVLHNMMRGSALKGLAGICPVKVMNEGYTIIRPLLGARRSEIEKWLLKQGQDFCTDSTNADNIYTRNRLRNVIIPMLQENINANAVPNIVQAAEFAQEAEEYISKVAQKAFKECTEYVPAASEHIVGDSVNAGSRKILIDLSEFNKNPDIIKKYIIYYALADAAGKAKDIYAVHVAEVMALIGKNAGASVNLPYSLIAERGYSDICISRGKEEIPELQWYARNGWYNADKKLIIEKFCEKNLSDLQENDYTKCINYDKIKFGLQLRTRQEGDYISVYTDGRTKKLKNYFIEQKVPAQYRDKVLLVADGNEIVWIVGFRLSESYKAVKATVNKAYIKINSLPICQNKQTD